MNLLSKWIAVYVVSNDGGMTGELQYSICESNSLRDVSNREGHVTAKYWISGGLWHLSDIYWCRNSPRGMTHPIHPKLLSSQKPIRCYHSNQLQYMAASMPLRKTQCKIKFTFQSQKTWNSKWSYSGKTRTNCSRKVLEIGSVSWKRWLGWWR